VFDSKIVISEHRIYGKSLIASHPLFFLLIVVVYLSAVKQDHSTASSKYMQFLYDIMTDSLFNGIKSRCLRNMLYIK
jgi:hypothetical protein